MSLKPFLLRHDSSDIQIFYTFSLVSIDATFYTEVLDFCWLWLGHAPVKNKGWGCYSLRLARNIEQTLTVEVGY